MKDANDAPVQESDSEDLDFSQESFHPLTKVESESCRICLMNEEKEQLVSPCKCKGSLALVHVSCLERWLSQHAQNHCELCMFEFNIIQIPRYSMGRALRLWVCHPRIRQHIREDLLLLSLLTFVTVGIIVVCFLGMQYFATEGLKLGISKICTFAMIGTFVSIVFVGYCVILFFLLKDQIVPWYNWWQKCVNIRLILDNSSN